MLKNKLNWRRPLFFLLLPIFFVLVFVGFPLPVAPPPAIKTVQEISSTVKKKKRMTFLNAQQEKFDQPEP